MPLAVVAPFVAAGLVGTSRVSAVGSRPRAGAGIAGPGSLFVGAAVGLDLVAVLGLGRWDLVTILGHAHPIPGSPAVMPRRPLGGGQFACSPPTALRPAAGLHNGQIQSANRFMLCMLIE